MVATRRVKRLIQFSIVAVLISTLLFFLQRNEISNSDKLNVKKRGKTSFDAEDEENFRSLFDSDGEFDVNEIVKEEERNAANSRGDDWTAIFNETPKRPAEKEGIEHSLGKQKTTVEENMGHVDKRKLNQLINKSQKFNITRSGRTPERERNQTQSTLPSAAAVDDHDKTKKLKHVVPTQHTKKLEDSNHLPAFPTWANFAWSNNMFGLLNVHVWQAWCGNTIHDLRRNRFFPLYPDVRLSTKKVFIQHWESDYGQRIFGFVHPPVSGKYTFAISSDDSSELWLSSNESPSNVQLLAWVGNRTLLSGEFHARIAQFTKYKTQLSHPVFLHSGQKYFIEVLHKQGRLNDHVLVGWQIPGLDHFRHLTGKSISLFIDDVEAPKDVTFYAKFIPQDLPSHSHDKVSSFKPDESTLQFGADDPRDKNHVLKFVDERDIANLFPSCLYNPSYLVDFKLNRYDGVTLIHDTAVYPADNTELTHMKQYDSCVLRRHTDSHGNSLASLAPSLKSKQNLYENGSIAVFRQEEGYLPLSLARTAAQRQSVLEQMQLKIQMDISDAKRQNQEVEDLTKSSETLRTSVIARSVPKEDQENTFEIKKKTKRKQAPRKRAQRSTFTEHEMGSNKRNITIQRKRSREDLQVHSHHANVRGYNERNEPATSTDQRSRDVVIGQLKSNVTATGNQRKLLSFNEVVNVKERKTSRGFFNSNSSSSRMRANSNSLSSSLYRQTYGGRVQFEPIDKQDDQLTRMNAAREFVRRMVDAVQRFSHRVNARVLAEAVYRRFGVKLEIPNIFRVLEYNAWLFHQNSTKCASDGNLLLNMDVALSVVNRYMHALRKATGSKYSLKEIVNVEENHDVMKGDRYLIDVELYVAGENSSVRLSQYVYQKLGSTELCLPQQFVLNQHTTVHIIIPVKNQGKWVQHFINNMVELYSETGDPHVNVIIVDFSSTDIDVTAALKRSALKRYQVRKLRGAFQRAYGIQAGAALVKNPRDIIFMCDLHLQIPSNIVDIIRKHCVRGKMAFAPIVARLHCGFSPSLPFGYWELQGYGLFAIYKSDFTRVGGMNYEEFRTTWGGEDWELLDRVLLSKMEVERLRVANFYHYYHSKSGMWGTRNMFNTNSRRVFGRFDDETDIIPLYNERGENGELEVRPISPRFGLKRHRYNNDN